MAGMKKQSSFLPVFFLFLILSTLVIFLSQERFLFGINFFQNALFPIEGVLFQVVHVPSGWFVDNKVAQLEAENRALIQKLVAMQKLQQDNAALFDQFQTTTIPSSRLLPATVIGEPEFIPGLTTAETMTLNKGKADGVHVGSTIVYKTNLIGLVTKTSDHASLVTLVSNKATSFTVKTSKTSAQGVLKGQGNGVMIMGNVLLPDTLRQNDIVLTNGSEDINGNGFPPGLIVGKIISVDKNPSSLYQSASVESLVNFSRLSTVFVME